MKNIYRQIRTYGIFINTLKIVAVMSMLVDHVAFYFYSVIPDGITGVMRAVGRLAMPLFVYILVQGFFKTKNFKRYITRIAICAVVTQLLVSALAYANVKLYPGYEIAVSKYGNILFSFVLTLLLLKVIHEPIILKKYTSEQNIIVKVVIAIVILSVYVFVSIDYGTAVPIFAMLLYAVERFKIMVLMAKESYSVGIKGFALNIVDHTTIEKVYKGLVALCFVLVIMFCDVSAWSLMAIPLVLLYNGEKRSQSKKMQRFYYVFFPLHHIVLYALAMLMSAKSVI